MKLKYYTELSNQFIYSIFYSTKKRKAGKFKQHHHTEIELGLILSGEGEYILNGKKYTASAGDLFIVRSNEQHCIPEVTSNTLVAFNIQLSTYFLWNICTDYIPPHKISALINSDVPITQKLNDSKIIMSIKNIARLLKDDANQDVYAVRKEVLNAVALICKNIDSTEKKQPATGLRIKDIQHVIDYIKANYKNQISLNDMAKIAAMSPSYFSGMFKAVSGMSPYNYLMTTRIEHAIEMLNNTNYAIMTIALECGFTSITSFNKAFKQQVGIVPNEVRRL